MGNEKKEEPPKVDAQGFKLFTIPGIVTMREKTWIYVSEIILSSFAIYSLICAIVAFIKLKSAATDVSNIATNWQATPIASVTYSSVPCAAGFSQVPFMTFPGIATLGCACDAGAMYQLDDNNPGTNVPKQVQAVSTPGAACLTNQTSSTIYKCMDLPSMPSFPMMSWKGGYLCSSTTLSGQSFPSAMGGQQAPDASGACASGFHNCGGTGADMRSTCEPDTTPGCPINWIGSDKTTALYNNPPTASLTSAGMMGAASVTSAAYPGATGGSTATSTFYAQVGKVQVVNVPQNWSPMPLVEVGTAMATPCYGEKNALTGTQSVLGGTVNNGANVAPTAPTACLAAQGSDTRFGQSDVYSAGTLAFENYIRQTGNACGNTPGTNVLTNYNSFVSGAAACSTSAAANSPNACLAATYPSGTSGSNPHPTFTCATTDNTCEQYMQQTKCGLWQSMQGSGDNAGLYQKSQIYWSDTCPYSKTDVINSEASLKSAIKVQTTLVILNTISNVVMILLGFWIACVAFGNRNEPNVNPASNLEHVWKPRLTNAFSFVKIPTIIATIAATSKIQKFYVKLSAANCAGSSAADALTNQTFIQLGKDLPSVTTSNIMVLVFDIIGWLPGIWAYISHRCAFKNEDSGIGLSSKDDSKSPNNGL